MARIDGRESERAFLRNKNKKKGTIDEHTCNITEMMMEDWLFLRFFFSFVAFNKKKKKWQAFLYLLVRVFAIMTKSL